MNVAGGGRIHTCLMGEWVRSILRYDLNGRSHTYDSPEAIIVGNEAAILEGGLGHSEELELMARQPTAGINL
jgi:hypothetical protein